MASEERLRLAARSIPQIFALYDRSGRYLFVNEAGTRLVGRDQDDLIGLSDDEVFGLSRRAGVLPPRPGDHRDAAGDERRVPRRRGRRERADRPRRLPAPAPGGRRLRRGAADRPRRDRRAPGRGRPRGVRGRARAVERRTPAVRVRGEPRPAGAAPHRIVSFVQLLERRYRGRFDDGRGRDDRVHRRGREPHAGPDQRPARLLARLHAGPRLCRALPRRGRAGRGPRPARGDRERPGPTSASATCPRSAATGASSSRSSRT